MRLPLRCAPFPDESLSGLLMRLAERNGMERIQMVSHVGLGRLPVLHPTFAGLQKLAAASGIPEETLDAMCFGQSTFGKPPAVTALNGVGIPASWITWKLAVCPECLAEAPYHRTKWHIVLNTTCPLHRCPILRACPHCSKRLRWECWPAVGCGCGWDISAAQRPMADKADISGQKWIWDLGRGYPAPRLLSDTRFDAAAEITLDVGWALLGRAMGRGMRMLPRFSAQCLEEGYRALDTDVEDFSSAIREAVLRGPIVVSRRLCAVALHTRSDNAAAAVLRDVATRYAPEPGKRRGRVERSDQSASTGSV